MPDFHWQPISKSVVCPHTCNAVPSKSLSFEYFDKVSNGANCVVMTEDIVCLSGKGPGVVQPGAKKKGGGGPVARSIYVFPSVHRALVVCMNAECYCCLSPGSHISSLVGRG